MSSKRVIAFVAIALALAMLGLGGCFKPSTTQSSSTTSQVATQQASVEPTAPANLIANGPITTPAAGSADRKALLDAARTKLGSTTQFYVYQLYVQGDTALGDLDPVSATTNGRVFVAWERRGGAWVAIGASKFGSKAANAADTARALPSFSGQLIGKIDWTFKKPVAKSTKTTAPSEAALRSSLTSAAQAWSNTAMSGAGMPYSIALLKIAKDSSGVWWGRAIVAPTGNFERLQFWAKYDAGQWSGSAQDPEPPAPSTYFPEAIVSKLGF